MRPILHRLVLALITLVAGCAHARGGAYRTLEVTALVRDGLREIDEVAPMIRDYPAKPPRGQWDWASDAETAMKYRAWITQGWPAETRGVPNPYAGLAFLVR